MTAADATELASRGQAMPYAVPWPDASLLLAPVLYCASFDPHEFNNARFADAGIDCPPHIARAVRKRQAEYFHGRLCARAALSGLCRETAVTTGMMREPVWPAGIVGSITHGPALAAAVALPSSRCRGIGIDIEEFAAPEIRDALRSTVVSAREYALLEELAHKIDIGILLTLVFSAKESFFKATSATVGRYFDFDALALQSIHIEHRALTFVVNTSLCAEWRRGQHVRIGYSLAFSGCVATLFAW